MKVQVTPTQLIETDAIVFAEADGLTVHPRTIVYLKAGNETLIVKVDTDYTTFVETINRKTNSYLPPGDSTIIA